MEVVDRVATEIKETLVREKIELYPPDSVIVQNTESNVSTNYDSAKEDLAN